MGNEKFINQYMPLKAETNKKWIWKKHVIDPTRESYQKRFKRTQSWEKQRKVHVKAFLFYFNKYWKKLLNIKKGWHKHRKKITRINQMTLCALLFSQLNYLLEHWIYCLQYNLKPPIGCLFHWVRFHIVWVHAMRWSIK